MADPDKRRLRLMNEVLPEPSPSAEGSPRQRTLANMQRLLALAATGAALSAGCTKPTEVPTSPEHPVESAATTATPSATSSDAAGVPTTVATAPPTSTAKPSASVVVAPSASTPPPPPPHVTATPVRGYGVVDPLPRPVRIPGKQN